MITKRPGEAGLVRVALVSLVLSLMALILAAYNLFLTSVKLEEIATARTVEHRERLAIDKQLVNAVNRSAAAIEKISK